MGKCRYDLTEDCNNRECLICILEKLKSRVELEKLGYPPSSGYYKAIVTVINIIDKYWRNTEINTERKCCDCKHFNKLKSGERGGVKGSCRIKSSSGYQDCRYGHRKACTRYYEPQKSEATE